MRDMTSIADSPCGLGYAVSANIRPQR